MKKLILGESYSREEVHGVFDSKTRFTPGAGIWGMHGFVKIQSRQNDYVFFVSLGQNKLGVEFDEAIDANGVLTWQSQKRHDLNHKTIQELIVHNHTKHNIYLFLRNQATGGAFSYLGTLAYIVHDPERENPVHFKWQLLDWPELDAKVYTTEKEVEAKKSGLEQTSPPESRVRIKPKRDFSSKKVDFVANAKIDRKVGLAGEKLAYRYIYSRLVDAGRKDLADKMLHRSIIEGDGAGYDIDAFDEYGNQLYIEVKTTTGGLYSDFFISPNELACSEEFTDRYRLYRIYDYEEKYDTGKFYKISGDMNEKLNLKPTQYTARP